MKPQFSVSIFPKILQIHVAQSTILLKFNIQNVWQFLLSFSLRHALQTSSLNHTQTRQHIANTQRPALNSIQLESLRPSPSFVHTSFIHRSFTRFAWLCESIVPIVVLFSQTSLSLVFELTAIGLWFVFYDREEVIILLFVQCYILNI